MVDEGIASRACMFRLRESDHEGDVIGLRAHRIGPLPHVPLFAQRVAVIGADNHNGIVKKAENPQGEWPKRDANPEDVSLTMTHCD